MSVDKFGPKNAGDEWSRKIDEIMKKMSERSFVDFRDAGLWQPATNLYESDAGYHVCVELAGTELGSIEVACVGERHVVISGARRHPLPEASGGGLSVHVMEIDHGPFRREIEVPEPFEVDAVDANYDKGYLWITLPKISKK